MPPTIDHAPSALFRETDKIVDRAGDDVLQDAFESDSDRLPLNVAVPIVLALNLSLWVGIGFIVRAFL